MTMMVMMMMMTSGQSRRLGTGFPSGVHRPGQSRAEYFLSTTAGGHAPVSPLATPLNDDNENNNATQTRGRTGRLGVVVVFGQAASSVSRLGFVVVVRVVAEVVIRTSVAVVGCCSAAEVHYCDCCSSSRQYANCCCSCSC